MKILFISHYNALYGANRSLESIVLYFKDKGEQVEVLFPDKGDCYYRLKNKGIKVSSFLFFYTVMYVKWNRKYLVLPILWVYNLFAFPFLIFKICRINPDIIYANSSIDLFSIWIARILRKKHVMHVREFLDKDFGAYFIGGKNLKRKILLKSDRIIFVSKTVAHYVVGNIPAYGRVMYDGIPSPNYVKIFSNKPDLQLGIVGNIDISKGQDLAIRYMSNIVKKFPLMKLHIIGDRECPYKSYLFDLINKLNLKEYVVWDGFISNIDDIYDRIDVLFMCSRFEGLGRVTVESMLRNIPVVGYDSGGTSELIDDYRTGFKFCNLKQVMDALNCLVYDKDKSLNILTLARKNAEFLFDEQHYVQELYSYIIGINSEYY